MDNKLWYVQVIKYYLMLKEIDLLSHEKTWRKLKRILQSQKSQSEEATYYIIPTIWHSGKGKTMNTVKGSVVAKSQGAGRDE